MNPKFIDLSGVTLTSTGQPGFGNADLTPISEALTSMVSGGEHVAEIESTNRDICSGSNPSRCVNWNNCSGTTNGYHCSNARLCTVQEQ